MLQIFQVFLLLLPNCPAMYCKSGSNVLKVQVLFSVKPAIPGGAVEEYRMNNSSASSEAHPGTMQDLINEGCGTTSWSALLLLQVKKPQVNCPESQPLVAFF